MADPVRILKAALEAVRRHHGQKRKHADLPYAVHPLRVAALAAAHAPPPGADPEACLLAALLHDTVEDGGWSREGIAEAFGDAVASVVAELTQDRTLPKAERRRRMIEHAGSMSPTARFVKLADRLDNLRDMEAMDREFQERYVREARALVARMHGTCPALEAEILTLADAAEARFRRGDDPSGANQR